MGSVNLKDWEVRFLSELMQLNLPELDEALDEIEFFERERTDRQASSWRSFCTRLG